MMMMSSNTAPPTMAPIIHGASPDDIVFITNVSLIVLEKKSEWVTKLLFISLFCVYIRVVSSDARFAVVRWWFRWVWIGILAICRRQRRRRCSEQIGIAAGEQLTVAVVVEIDKRTALAVRFGAPATHRIRHAQPALICLTVLNRRRCWCWRWFCCWTSKIIIVLKCYFDFIHTRTQHNCVRWFGHADSAQSSWTSHSSWLTCSVSIRSVFFFKRCKEINYQRFFILKILLTESTRCKYWRQLMPCQYTIRTQCKWNNHYLFGKYFNY